jgi:IS30 family transposase
MMPSSTNAGSARAEWRDGQHPHPSRCCSPGERPPRGHRRPAETQPPCRAHRRRRPGPSRQGRGLIVDAISISDRPAEIEERAVPGHWEGDLLAGGGNTHIATLVERRSRFVILVKVPAKTTEAVVDALRQRVLGLPEDLMRTLTWDRGLELAEHKRFTVDTGVQVYFCDPKSPWQRGSNENTNGLLRQYFPKGMNLGPSPRSSSTRSPTDSTDGLDRR